MMSKKELRQNELVLILQSQGFLPIKVLAAMLNVSEMTIRRDLESLAFQPVDAAPTMPLAQPSPGQNSDYNLLYALKKSNAQKERIGEFAASLIEPNDVVIIDTGSTTVRIIPYLPEDKKLTVLCYTANIMLALRHKRGIDMMLSGGVFHPNTEMFESTEGVQFIQRIRANKVFLSAAGVHRELGITCANTYEMPTKEAVLKSSLQRILLADSSKFGQLRSVYVCDLSAIDVVVTDRNLPDSWRELIWELGITLHLV